MNEEDCQTECQEKTRSGWKARVVAFCCNVLSFMCQVIRDDWQTSLAVVTLLYWPLQFAEFLSIYVGTCACDSDFLGIPSPCRNLIAFCGGAFFWLFLFIIPYAALYHIALRRSEGNACSLQEAVSAGFQNYGRMFVVRFQVWLVRILLLFFSTVPMIIVGALVRHKNVPMLLLASAFALVTIGIPLTCLFVANVRWAVAEVVTVSEGSTGTAALGRSWRLTRGKFVEVLCFLFLAGLPLIPGNAVFYFVLRRLCWPAGGGPTHWWDSGLGALWEGLFQPFVIICCAGIYAQLRKLEKEEDSGKA